jgi:hypothetical protein
MAARRSSKRKAARLAPLSEDGKAQLDEIIDQAVDSDDERKFLESKMEEIERLPDNNDLQIIKACIQSLWRFFEGVRLLGIRSNEEAARLFQRCANEFERFNIKDFKDVSIALFKYASAIEEMRKNNLGQALTMAEEAKNYLKDVGGFGSDYEILIDLLEPEVLFLYGQQAVNRLNYVEGETYFNKACQAAEQVATKYYKDNKRYFNTFQGMGLFYKAFSSYLVAYDQFRRFEFDRVSSNKDLSSLAKRAKATLEKGKTEYDIVRIAILLSDTMSHMLDAIRELANMMQKVLNSTSKADVKKLKHIQKEVSIAKQSASKIGPAAVGLVTACDNLYSLVNNLERLAAKPNKKDFGIFSGLISAALFFPLFFVISWANANYKIGIDPLMIIYPSIILALIGGFGLGAAKFASLLSPFQSKTDQ